MTKGGMMPGKTSGSQGKQEKDIQLRINAMLRWQKRAEASFAKKMGPATSETLDATISYQGGD